MHREPNSVKALSTEWKDRDEDGDTQQLEKRSFAILSRNIGRRIRTRWGTAIFVATLGYLALRIYGVHLKVKLPPDSFLGLSLEPVANILDNLFASVLIILVAYVMRDALRDWFKDIRTVKTLHFNSLDQCLELLSSAMATYKDEIERAHITILAPLLFSREYIQYYFAAHKDSTGAITEKRKGACIEALHKFQDLLDRMVAVGSGAYDRTLLGRTGNAAIDQATLRIVTRAFEMDSGKPPGSSLVGYHSNLNEYATFIFGQCHSELEEVAVRFDFMLMVQFDTSFRDICGYICFDEQTIKQNYEFYQSKIDGADRKIESRSNKPIELPEWNEFCGELKKFFSPL